MKSLPRPLSRPFILVLTAISLVLWGISGGFGAGAKTGAAATAKPNNPDLVSNMPDNLPKATFAGGCFWCLESEFRKFPGVVYTRVGYTGGTLENPTYEQITTGRTGHAETIEIYYDADKTSFHDLVDHFLRRAHDPTTKNAQWVDRGPQYRSAIFYHDDEQKRTATDIITRIDAEGLYKNKIVTEVTPAIHFWPAEDYHQQYYEKYEDRTGQAHQRVIAKEQIKAKKYGRPE